MKAQISLALSLLLVVFSLICLIVAWPGIFSFQFVVLLMTFKYGFDGLPFP